MEKRLASLPALSISQQAPHSASVRSPSPSQYRRKRSDADILSLVTRGMLPLSAGWLLSQLFSPLGMTPVTGLAQVVAQTSPGRSSSLRGFLQRLPLKRLQSSPNSIDNEASLQLARKLASFLRVKGECLPSTFGR